MGTRNLTVVFMDGKYRVAQYGQWDGYPEGQGIVFLNFLTEHFVEHKFRTNLRNIKTLETAAEADALDKLFKNNWPAEFSRDTGAEILRMIQDGGVKSGFLFSDIKFAADGLFCEWVWVLDLDKRTFEAYKGCNKEPLTEKDRFYFLADYEDNGYHGAKLVHEWSLSNLPSEKEFLQTFEKDSDEE